MERKSSLSMEAIKFYGYRDQTISPYKSHVNGSKRIINNPFISMHHPDNFMLHKMGVLQAPPPSFHSLSYPPYTFQQPPLPPLLPLPTAKPHQVANRPGVTRSLPVNNKVNSTNRPKKSKSSTKNSKKDEKNVPKRVTVSSATTSDANKQLKDVKKALPSVPIGTSNNGVIGKSFGARKVEEDHVGMFSSSGVFTISPPPSSLPLPTFSLRPKRGCGSEAVPATDISATDNLRRILQLR